MQVAAVQNLLQWQTRATTMLSSSAADRRATSQVRPLQISKPALVASASLPLQRPRNLLLCCGARCMQPHAPTCCLTTMLSCALSSSLVGLIYGIDSRGHANCEPCCGGACASLQASCSSTIPRAVTTVHRAAADMVNSPGLGHNCMASSPQQEPQRASADPAPRPYMYTCQDQSCH